MKSPDKMDNNFLLVETKHPECTACYMLKVNRFSTSFQIDIGMFGHNKGQVFSSLCQPLSRKSEGAGRSVKKPELVTNPDKSHVYNNWISTFVSYFPLVEEVINFFLLTQKSPSTFS